MVVLSCIAAGFAAYFYFQAANKEDDTYRKIGRKLFQLQAFAVVSVFVILFYIIFKHYYEFFYAWRHSNNSLPVYYMISCFWEGQEGSFLLWMFWNAMLGLVLTRTAKSWESPVMAVMALAQFALATMLIGFKYKGFHIGSSPFDLFREVRGQMIANIPAIEGKAKYLMALKDGNGLNPLLQNYWMVIHPPTLFLGFALAVVPFAYSIAGLWKNRDREWLNPALKWSLVCVGVLGTGIIMGGFWAYESLSFGGYWAWDPVENASLMPWLIMAAAAHMVLISRNTGRHLFTTHLLIQITWWLVLYATFLTRSGILGDASVHSFTDLGLSGQLLIFFFIFILISLAVSIQSVKIRASIFIAFVASIIAYTSLWASTDEKTFSGMEGVFKNIFIGAFFIVLGAYLYFLYKRTVSKMEDEKWSSRELWMFLGSMFLILSLVQVFSATSIPVFNKLFGFTTAVPKAEFYNKLQVWLAMPVMILMAVGQFFRYRETNMQQWLRSYIPVLIITIIAFILAVIGFEVYEFKYALFLFIGILLVVGNIVYLRQLKSMEWLGYGSSIAHAGFGILLVGALVSSVKQNIISSSAGINLAPEVDDKGKPDAKAMNFNRENRILYKNKTEDMGEYKVTYRSFAKGTGTDTIDKYFNILFEKYDAAGKLKDSFSLNPKTQSNPNMGLIAEPSTRHFLHKDVFTHVNYESSLDKKEPFSSFKQDEVVPGQEFLTESGKIKLRVESFQKMEAGGEGIILRLIVTAQRLEKKATLFADYIVNTQENIAQGIPLTNDTLGLYLNVEKLNVPASGDPKSGLSFVMVTAERSPSESYIVVKAIVFPWINLVWSGTIIMVFGVGMALAYRVKQQRKLESA